MPRDRMNGVDIAVLLAEVGSVVEDAYIDNLYLLNEDLIVKLRSRGVSSELVVKVGRAIYLTGFEKVKPLKPKSFVMLLRKHLSGSRIVKVEQRSLERVVTFHTEGGKGEHKLIIELFARGNVILLEKGGIIEAAMRRVRSKSRVIKPGLAYAYPPALKDPRKLSFENLTEVEKMGSKTLQRALSRATGLPPPYAEEVLLRSGVDPSAKPSILCDVEILKRVYRNTRLFLEEVFHEPVKPVIYRDERGIPVDFSPVPLTMYDGLEASRYKSFNEAVDIYFTELEEYERTLEEMRKVKAEVERRRRILSQQMEALQRLKVKAENYRRVGGLLMAKLHLFQELMLAFTETLREVNLEEAERILRDRLSQEGFRLLKVEMGGRVLQIEGWGVRFKLYTGVSPAENASRYYRLAKEAEDKVRRIEKAMTEAKHLAGEADRLVLKPVKTGAWYERFRYTFTRDGFLLVGGKDASTNELLINRYMEPGDLVFHADYVGSPFVLLKTDGRDPTPEVIREAAVFTVCYSRAWRDGLASLDAFYVKPDQVSKRAPSGEYLPRGSFMIRGGRSHVHRVPLRLCIGVKVYENGVRLLVGSEDGVRGWLDAYVSLRPGRVDKRVLAEAVRQRLERRLLKKVLREVKLPINEIYRLIPGSGGVLEEG